MAHHAKLQSYNLQDHCQKIVLRWQMNLSHDSSKVPQKVKQGLKFKTSIRDQALVAFKNL